MMHNNRKVYNFITIFLLTLTTNCFAVPAKLKWQTVNQSDGSTITIALTGDERMHYFITTDGMPVGRNAKGDYCHAKVHGNKIALSDIVAHEKAQRTAEEQTFIVNSTQSVMKAKGVTNYETPAARQPRVSAPKKSQANFTGSKRAPVILASFVDKSFADNDEAIVNYYNRVLNEPGYSENGAPGSVHDYFSDMSRGVFDLQFDIIGPVRVSKSCTYYGGPSAFFGGTDYIGEFITEAIQKADEKFDIDWSKYDWNDDGEVEQVFVVYAGYGQATGGATGTIWPNAWTLDDAATNGDGNGGFSLDNVYINQYACSNELYSNSGKKKMGLGVFCHEFSHCMGLPDVYDTNYGGTPTMGDWDLLAHGSYNGPQGIGWCPAGWTSYERAYAGWLTLIELQEGDQITEMTDLEDPEGNAYIVYNDNHPDEYYLLENHKNRKWDAYTPENGLLIIHVDYDELLFFNNIVNSTGDFPKEEGYTEDLTNDHPRMYPFSKVRSISDGTYYYTYPMVSKRSTVDCLTDESTPAAMLYNEQADGTLFMHKPICNIAKDEATGNISFNFMPGGETAIKTVATEADKQFYDLSGRKVAHPQKGIYIVNGQKKCY